MLCKQFRTIPYLSITLCAFTVLTFVAGCDSGVGTSADPSPNHEVVSSKPETIEPSATVSEATADTVDPEVESGQPVHETGLKMPQSSLAPLPSPEELGQQAPAPLPTPNELDQPAPGMSTSPALPTLPEIEAPATTEIPKPALPPLAAPSQALELKPPTPFSENPLREGSDDFVAEPGMPEPGNQPGRAASSSQAIAAPATEASVKPVGKKSSKASGDFDPIAVNGEIFVNWQKPKVALVISGRQDGYLEPCGCAGLDRMKGGLTRRHSLFKELTAKGWPVVAMDCGGLVKGFGRQAELKFHLSVDAMQKMGYDAIALGKTDLRLPAGELLSRVASSEDAPSPFLSANVAIFGFAAGMTADHRIVDAGGVRVGITSILGSAWQKEINNTDVEMVDPAAKLRAVLPKLKERSDVLVLLAHATMDESKRLAEEFPEFDIVVTGGGNPEPPKDKEVLPGGTVLIEVGEKGMDAIVLGIYGDDKIEYQRVPLDSRFEDSLDMKEFMRQYQQQLKADGLAGLGIRQVPHPQAAELGKFVGSKKCENCHEESYDVWKKTGHADAWKTLVELEVPRNHDPECISCHVIGWHPTEYFPYESGFLSEVETPRLIDVGCENCHGPGEKHIEAEMADDEELQKKLQKAMVVTKEQSQHDKTRWCLNCHDLDNSPDFDFEEYWPNIEHSEANWDDDE
jgi:cytochrome c554/c'-like protein